MLLKLKSGVKVEDLPHQIRVAGEVALVVAPGRPMQCLRCQGTGHVRRECKVPRCSRCRRFGHGEDECMRTYPSAIGSTEGEETAQLVMDATEAEDAAKGAGDLATSDTSGCTAASIGGDGPMAQAEKEPEAVVYELACQTKDGCTGTQRRHLIRWNRPNTFQ